MAEIDFHRVNQNQFIIFNGQKEHEDDVIQEVQKYIKENFEDRLIVEELATKFAQSNRNFIRRFKKATQNTPFEYIQCIKVEAAKKVF